MTSLLKQVLFKEIPLPSGVSRSIRFDITDPDQRFMKGTINVRIINYLKFRDEPLTAKEIAKGIGTSTNQVYVQLKRLVQDQKLKAINIDGFHPEYFIS